MLERGPVAGTLNAEMSHSLVSNSGSSSTVPQDGEFDDDDVVNPKIRRQHNYNLLSDDENENFVSPGASKEQDTSVQSEVISAPTLFK